MEKKQEAAPLDANAVRALIAAKYPNALTSPLAQVFAAATAKDEAERACGLAKLQAVASVSAEKREAFKHAMSCIEACEAQGLDYDEDTLSHNIESNFPELGIDDCDEIVRAVISRAP